MMSRIRKPITYSCSFCNKNQRQVKRLIAGPGGVYVCNECIALFVSTSTTTADEQNRRCSFCGKHQAPTLAVIEGPHKVSICRECIDLCVEIITEEEHIHNRGGLPE